MTDPGASTAEDSLESGSRGGAVADAEDAPEGIEPADGAPEQSSAAGAAVTAALQSSTRSAAPLRVLPSQRALACDLTLPPTASDSSLPATPQARQLQCEGQLPSRIQRLGSLRSRRSGRSVASDGPRNHSSIARGTSRLSAQMVREADARREDAEDRGRVLEAEVDCLSQRLDQTVSYAAELEQSRDRLGQELEQQQAAADLERRRSDLDRSESLRREQQLSEQLEAARGELAAARSDRDAAEDRAAMAAAAASALRVSAAAAEALADEAGWRSVIAAAAAEARWEALAALTHCAAAPSAAAAAEQRALLSELQEARAQLADLQPLKGRLAALDRRVAAADAEREALAARLDTERRAAERQRALQLEEAGALHAALGAARGEASELREQLSVLRRERNEAAGELRAERALRSDLLRRFAASGHDPGGGPGLAASPPQAASPRAGLSPPPQRVANGDDSGQLECRLASLQRRHERSKRREMQARQEAALLRAELRQQRQLQSSSWCSSHGPPPIPVPWATPPQPQPAPVATPQPSGPDTAAAAAQPLAEESALRERLAQRDAEVARLSRAVAEQEGRIADTRSSAAELLQERAGEIQLLRSRVRELAQGARCAAGISTPVCAPRAQHAGGAATPPPPRPGPPPPPPMPRGPVW
eukprot:TRINITY_DN3887_c1_g1_i1.p1 TRINITY_DN3887_c1_g1~~TRINITY_DN3887_c1_g1_i1.p1  ORF type:complete len:653 (+),score=215.95 TRINITY_DN3887_c1_g1_i1:86-2044(+)